MKRHTSLLLVCCVLSAVACERPVERPRSVLLVSLDTVRADRIGCYGRENAGTPTLDGLAARGARFADATAPSPMTLPSHATLLSGQDTLRHRVRHNGLFAVPDETTTIAERFRQASFRTGAFVGSFVLAEHFGLDQGFETYRSPGRNAAPGLLYVSERPAGEVNREALAWLDTLGEEPFFLFVHYMEPHAPYEPPEPERSRFAEDRYQGEIATADRMLGQLLAGLHERGHLDETLVLVTADHGESLGEHGEQTHGLLLYQSTLHVPLLAAGPGVRGGLVVQAPVGLVDVAATLLDATGLARHEPLDGRSLWPAMGGATPPVGRALYAETFVPRFDFGWSELRALREGTWKYVESPRAELFSLDRDPAESRNRIAEESVRAERMRAALKSLADRVERAGEGPDTVRLSPQQRQALEGLGYVMGRREADGAGDLPDPKDRVGELPALDRVDAMMRAEAYSAAERLAREVIDAHPTYLDLRIRLLLALILQGKVEAAAAEGRAFDEAARSVPQGMRVAAKAHILLGQMYLDHARIEEAAHEYERALVAPQSSKIHDLLAAIYHDLGRRDDALRVLRALVDRGDASPRSLRMLHLLEREGP
jgi:arylsulfatase A-like enzyme